MGKKIKNKFTGKNVNGMKAGIESEGKYVKGEKLIEVTNKTLKNGI